MKSLGLHVPEAAITPVGRVISVNVGQPRIVEWQGRSVRSSIWKEPVEGRVRVQGVNVAGDLQSDLGVHGGETKAVYGYAIEDIRWWETVLGHALAPGAFGENLTLAEVDLTAARPGDRWRIGTALLEVTTPRFPCFKLGMRHGDEAMPDRFQRAARPGAYFRILEGGAIGAGDAATLETPSSAGSATVGSLFRAKYENPA